MLTLGQAAKEAGVAKSAISRAIKIGRLSARKMENGSFEIDPAELFRVYPRNGCGQPKTEPLATHKEHQQEHLEIAVMRELIEEIKGERDSLRIERERLLKVIEGQAETVKLLTHQPTQKDKATYWWWFWAAVVLTIITLAAAPLFWPVLRQASVDTKPLNPTPPATGGEPWKPDDGG